MEAISLFVKSPRAFSERIERDISAGLLPCKKMSFAPNEYLFHESDMTDHTFYIHRGLVRLFSESIEGYAKTVFFYKAGSLVGFQGFQEAGERNRSILCATATTRCEVCAIDNDVFEKYLRGDADVCFEMARYLFTQMALSTRESVNASIYPVLQRFSALLLALADELKLPQAPAVIPFTNEELASMLGVHPNSISNSIAALRNADCVEKQRASLLITDFKKLKRVAENLITEKE